MIQKAERVCQILKDNYLNVWKVKIDSNIVKLEKPIDYLIDNPNQAVKVTVGINKEDVKYLQDCFTDIFNYVLGFRMVIIDQIDKPILDKYQEVTCLLVF